MKKIMFNDRYGLTQAVIDGRKTMTRRLINPMPEDCTANHKNYWGAYWSDEPMALEVERDTGGIYCKYCGNGVRWFEAGYYYNTKYKLGDIVAVAQSYKSISDKHPDVNTFLLQLSKAYGCKLEAIPNLPGWKNKMFSKAELMPHQIRITDVRCERLQDISDSECLREGVQYIEELGVYYFERTDREEGFYFDSPREAFASLIDKVSGKGTWENNPWVIVYEFELVK